MKSLWLILLLPLYLLSQPATESQRQAILKLPDDSGKVNKLIALSNKIQHTEPEQSVLILNNAINLSKKVKYDYGLSVAYGGLGIIYSNKQQLDSCKMYTDLGYALVEGRTDKDSRNQSGVLMNSYGAIYQNRGYYDSALAKYLSGAAIFKETKNYKRLAFSYFNTSLIYTFLNDTAKTEYYARLAYQVAFQTTDTLVFLRAIMVMANIHSQAGRYDSVETYARRGLEMALQFKETFTIGKFYLFLGDNQVRLFHNSDSAIYYFNKAYDNTVQLESPTDISIILHELGLAYKGKKDYPSAIKYLKEGADLQEKNKLDHLLIYSLEELIAAEEEAGNARGALKYLRQFLAIKDSLNVRNNREATNELEVKYQTQLKDEQLKLQQATIAKKNTLNYILIGCAVSLLIISLLSYRTYKQKRKLQEQKITDLEKEKLLLATQSILKGQEEERSRLAKDLHDGLGGLLSGVKLQLGAMKGNLILSEEHGRTFNNALGKLDESISEMRRVAHNMMPEALMKLGLQQALQDYCDGLSESQPFKINCEFHGLENRMPPSTEIVVYRIVQELLNNAVKHSEAGVILAQVIRQGDNLSITVEDNGKGFDISQTDITKGAGLANVKARVDYLKGQMDIQSAPGKGTSVHIDCIIDGNG